MAVISTGNHPKLLWPGVNAVFGMSYDEKSIQCDQLFAQNDSSMAREEDVEATSFGLAPTKTEGGAISYDSHNQGGTAAYVHTTYGMGYIVTEEEIEDNLYKSVAEGRAQALGFSMRQTREVVHALTFNRAFNSSYTGYDGKELCATDHPTIYGDQSNELATPADLSEAAIEDLAIQIRNAVNSRGLKISIRPRRLIVPPSLEFEAQRIVNSAKQSGTANNDLNAIKRQGIFGEGIFVYDYLTDTDAWFIQTDAPNGLKTFNRRALKFGKDNDFDTGNAKAKATMRFSNGHSEWRSLYGSPGAA